MRAGPARRVCAAHGAAPVSCSPSWPSPAPPPRSPPRRLQHSTRLVAGGIACYAGAGTGASSYYNVEALGRTPKRPANRCSGQTGRPSLGQPGVKLVACADPHGYVAVFKATGAAAQCGSEGMSPLQGTQYATAQSRVDRLVAALAAVGANQRCIPPSTLVRDSQQALDSLGWRGWHAQFHGQPVGEGGCGLFEGTGSSFSDPTASLDATHHVVWIVSGPIPALIQLTASQDMKLLRASGDHCYTPAGARGARPRHGGVCPRPDRVRTDPRASRRRGRVRSARVRPRLHDRRDDVRSTSRAGRPGLAEREVGAGGTKQRPVAGHAPGRAADALATRSRQVAPTRARSVPLPVVGVVDRSPPARLAAPSAGRPRPGRSRTPRGSDLSGRGGRRASPRRTGGRAAPPAGQNAGGHRASCRECSALRPA